MATIPPSLYLGKKNSFLVKVLQIMAFRSEFSCCYIERLRIYLAKQLDLVSYSLVTWLIHFSFV